MNMKIQNIYNVNLRQNCTFGAKKTIEKTEQTPKEKDSAVKVEEINPTNKALFEKLKAIFELREDDLNEKINQYCKDRTKNVYPEFYIEDKGKPTLELTNIIGQNLYSCTQYDDGKNVSYRFFVVDVKQQKIKEVFDIHGDKIYGPCLKTEKTNNERITKALVALNEYENQAKRAKMVEIIGSISNVQGQLFSFIEKQEKTNSNIYNKIDSVDKAIREELRDVRKELEKHSLDIKSLQEDKKLKDYYIKMWAKAGMVRIPSYKPPIIAIPRGPNITTYIDSKDLSEAAVEKYILEHEMGCIPLYSG